MMDDGLWRRSVSGGFYIQIMVCTQKLLPEVCNVVCKVLPEVV